MAAAAQPIQAREVASLVAAGIGQQYTAFPNVTMESDSCICVRETEEKRLAVVDLANPTAPNRRPMQADSVIRHPKRDVLAVKLFANGTETLQIFDLASKQKLKAHALGEQVALWKWVNDEQIGLVTLNAVYHWDLAGDAAPVKVFDRAPNLASTQVISYKVSPDRKWCVLIGIAAGAPEHPALVKGQMQLWSVEQQRTQALDAHAAAFAAVKLPGKDQPSTLIAFAQKTFVNGAINSKLHIIELGAPGGGAPLKKQQELFFPPEFDDDFPVALHIAQPHQLVYAVTKLGLVFVYDLTTGTAIFRNRFSQQPVFLCQDSSQGGVLALNRAGQVHLLTVNDAAIVPYLATTLNAPEVALDLARRANLPGADQMAVQHFERLLSAGQYKEAAELAAESPKGILRTEQVVNRLKLVQAQPPPLLQYFGLLLSKYNLNAFESVELASLVLQQGKKHLLVKWFEDGKLTSSERLGDVLAQSGDNDMALQCYQKAGSSGKVVTLLAAKGDFQQLVAYTGQTGTTPDYLYLLQVLMKDNPQGAVNLAKQICKQTPQPVPTNTIAELFLQRNMVREATAFLLEALEGDRAEDAPLQTKVIEINLITNPQVADAILAAERFTHYDRPRVAQLCERAGLYMRALQHYTEISDIKRVIVNTHAIPQNELVEYFGSLSADWALECLKELLSNLQQNLQLVVNVAREYREQLTEEKILEMFDSRKCHQGVFFFLQSFIMNTDSVDLHCRYVEAAARTGQVKEVERMTRESEHLDPPRIKAFLMEARLPDMRPLINVCDRYDMVYDMTTYLYKQGLTRYIEGYCQKVSPSKTSEVCGALLDLDADQAFLNQLIISVRSLLHVEPLVAEFEKRYKLKLLSPFLEHLVNEGSTDVHVHNALGKIMIETNNNPEHFVLTNPYYDPVEVGRFAEKRDPQLACVAYKRGQCDDELLRCTNKNSLFKVQARYVVERKSPELWAKVLDDENEHRRHLLDQVVAHVLPESKDPEQVSVAVKSFMAAGMQAELIELLEKIVLTNSSFSNNGNLQNLLIITAIKTEGAQSRVMDYTNRLDNFDGPNVAEIAVEYELFEEAFHIYKKFQLHTDAMRVLLGNLNDLDRALEYATKVDEKDVWSVMAEAQLGAGQVAEAIGSYIRAEDAGNVGAVVAGAEEAGCWEDLVRYLLMARKQVKDARVDSELLFAYARTDNLAGIEELINGPHMANLEVAGDRCFNAQLYHAAKVLFRHIPNWGRLASALVHLHEFSAAVDAARKANSIRTWKEVCFACVAEGEFKLAQLCGLNIIVNAEELDEVSQFYMVRGHVDQLIALFESGIGSDRAHMGIFTELGALYARFRPDKLMEHLKLFTQRLNIPRLLRVCETYQQWRALAYLYVHYDEFDNALLVMMEHSPDAWEHVGFKDTCVKVSSIDLYYKAIEFYLEEHPDMLADLLRVLEIRVDHARVVDILRRRNLLPLIKDYLLSVQKANLAPINDAVNGLLIEEEDYEGLRESITTHDNFDQVQLASRLEKHELTQMRRIAILIFKRNLRWKQALALCKRDGLWKDAIEVAAQSGDRDLVETEVLRFFVSEGLHTCFASALYSCYDLVRPDVVMELAWANGLTSVCMPFMIQSFRDLHAKVDTLMAERKEAKAREAKEEEGKQAQQVPEQLAAMYHQPLALPAPAQLVGQAGAGMYDGGYDGGMMGMPASGNLNMGGYGGGYGGF